MYSSMFEFVCAELKELDDKAKAGKVTMSDIDYGDKLEHYKKSVLTNHAMEAEGYSNRDGHGGSYADDRPRDARGRYRASFADYAMADELRYRAKFEKDDASRRDMERMADRIERGA